MEAEDLEASAVAGFGVGEKGCDEGEVSLVSPNWGPKFKAQIVLFGLCTRPADISVI